MTCNINNHLICLTCLPYYFINSSSTCAPCISNCQNCSSSLTCNICFSGYFRNGNGTCQLCPTNCTLCSYNSNISQPECSQCVSGSYVTTIVPRLCTDYICGDSLTLLRPCDLALGNFYDGCTDNCQIEDNFTCSVDNATYGTMCSFNGTLDMNVVHFKRIGIDNKL